MGLLWKLFIAFARIGAVTFGGGYAMLPILQRDIVEKNHWATDDELMDYFALGQCTPGMIAVNTATFIGCKLKGISGGIAATLGVITPSMIFITIIAMFLSNFAEYAVVKHAFAGIRACVCILILDAVLKLGRKSIRDTWGVIIFLVILGGSLFTPVSPAVFIILAGVAGYVIRTWVDRKEV
jgi:chromate transporter